MRDEILMDVLNHVLNKTCGIGWQRVAMDSRNTKTNRKVRCRVAKDSISSQLRIRRFGVRVPKGVPNFFLISGLRQGKEIHSSSCFRRSSLAAKILPTRFFAM